MEEWRPVVGYEGTYQVSDEGRVRRIAPAQGGVAGYILKGSINRRGYHVVLLRKNGRTHNHTAHRLVAHAFLVKPDIADGSAREEVNHVDGVKANNRLTNLEWTTSRKNAAHAWSHKLRRIPASAYRTGMDRPNTKLTDAQVLAIRTSSDTGRSLARRFDVSEATVSMIRTGKRRIPAA